MAPLISVLMPVYNAETTLSECLDSISRQSHENFEVVAVDDGSTDESPNIIEKYAIKDNRFRLIREKRRGIVPALNHGIKECRGRYVARMDADDIMETARLKSQIEFLADRRDIDLLGSLVTMVGRNQFLPSGVLKYESWTNSLVEHHEIVSEIFVESPIVHPTFFARKTFYLDLGGYRDLPWAEDYDIILRAYLRGLKFEKVPESLLFWRDSATRLMRNDERYRRNGMFSAKVYYFMKKGFLSGKKGVVIAGSGPTGRSVARKFMENGVSVASFIDDVKGPDNRKVMGVSAFGEGKIFQRGFLQSFNGYHFILCIGDSRGKKQFMGELKKEGYEEKDYTPFI